MINEKEKHINNMHIQITENQIVHSNSNPDLTFDSLKNFKGTQLANAKPNGLGLDQF